MSKTKAFEYVKNTFHKGSWITVNVASQQMDGTYKKGPEFYLKQDSVICTYQNPNDEKVFILELSNGNTKFIYWG